MKKINKILIVILIFVLSFTLSSCNEEKEKLTLFSGTYAVKELTYHYFLISYVPSLELVVIDENNDNYYFQEDSSEQINGKLIEFELTKKNFDKYFNEDDENFSWQNHENLTETIRKENNRAWYVDTQGNLTWYFLLQNDGSKYVVYVINNDTEKRIDNIYHLEQLF